MSSITELLAAILAAKKGEEVRGSIHDAIEMCYQDGKAGANDLQARQLIEAVAAVNEQQQSALEVLQARVEELESGEGGSSQQSTTIDIPTVLVDGGVVENVSVNNNSTTTRHITFTTEFTETPKVMVAIGKNVGAVSQYGYLSANILYPSVTTTGFDFFLANRSGSDRSPGVVWYAYQPTVKTIDLDITIPDTEGMTEAEVREITGPIAAAVDAIKTGYNGTTYQTAAEAVRTQINDLHVLIGDTPGAAIQASAVAYNNSNVAAELTNVNGRLEELEGGGENFTTVTEIIQTYPTGGGDDPEPTEDVNKINPNDHDAQAGKYINDKGAIYTKSNGTVSGYIPVLPGVWYSYHYLATLQPGKVTFNLYNESKTFVDYWAPDPTHERIKWLTDSNNHVYMAFKLSDTSTARYVRVNLTTAAIGVYAMFVEGDTMPSEYIPYTNGGSGGDETTPQVYTVERNALASAVADLGPKRIRLDMELGTFGTYGGPSSAFSPLPSARRRTAFYIKTNGATSFSLLDLGLYEFENIYLETYGTNMVFRNESEAITSPVNIPIASGVEYIKFVVRTEEKIRTLDAVFYGGIYAPEQVKNIPISTSQSNQMLFDITEETFGCARILLPSTYSVDGAPVPLILYIHGSGMMTSWNREMARYSFHKYFADEGFAVLEVFGWDNEDWTTYGQGTDGVDPYPIPYWIKMYEKAVEKACTIYNIDRDNIHMVCKSQGGQLAYHYVSNPPTFPIRSVSMFAPVLDYLSMNGSSTSADSRRVLAREMEFEGNVETDYVGQNTYGTACSAFLSANIEKVNGLNEAWRGLVGQTLAEKFAASMDNGSKWWSSKSRTDIYTDTDLCRIGFIPTKIWAATNDTETPYRKSVEAVAQLNNGGTEAHMRLFDTGGHAINTSTGPQTTNVTAANGTVWSTIPTCIYEAAQWMKSKMPHGSI